MTTSRRTLDRDETLSALREVWGEVPISVDDFETLFSFLDADGSNSLDWEEFKTVAKQANVLNAIQDYIPLAEVEKVEWKLVDKDKCTANNNLTHTKSFKRMERKGSITESELADQVQDLLARSSALPARPTWAKSLFNVMERYTGIDFDGDGQSENILIPRFDPENTEVHLIILTVEGGHNSGRSERARTQALESKTRKEVEHESRRVGEIF